MKTRVTSDVHLSGGTVRCEDGTWQVECVFGGLNEREAEFISIWLERLICVNIIDVADQVEMVPRAPN